MCLILSVTVNRYVTSFLWKLNDKNIKLSRYVIIICWMNMWLILNNLSIVSNKSVIEWYSKIVVLYSMCNLYLYWGQVCLTRVKVFFGLRCVIILQFSFILSSLLKRIQAIFYSLFFFNKDCLHLSANKQFLPLIGYVTENGRFQIMLIFHIFH